MSHKEKICTTALATHVEQCFPSFSFAPLIIEYDREVVIDGPAGLQNVIESGLIAKYGPTIEEYINAQPDSKEVAKAFFKAGNKALKKCEKPKKILDTEFLNEMETQVASAVRGHQKKNVELFTTKMFAEAGPTFNVEDPETAFDARLDVITEFTDFDSEHRVDFIKPRGHLRRELPQLGMFFSEATCFRCEGIAYEPCGKESTILPGESISETYSAEEQLEQNVTDVSTESAATKETTKVTNDQTLTQSFERNVKKITDLKKSISGSVKGKLFKVLDVGLESNSSASFQKIIESISKSSSILSRTFMNEVVNDIKVSNSLTINTQLKAIEKSELKRSLKNETDVPRHFIERQPYCVSSVIQKRTNVQLAWSACIDEPGRDLCRPDTLHENYADDISMIRGKWANAPAPHSFGPRPQNTRVCSEAYSSRKGGPHWGQGNTKFEESKFVAIPPGHSYVAGTADIEMLHHNSDLVFEAVTAQPNNGTTGAGNFSVLIKLDNKFNHQERITYRICFEVKPDAAIEYDNQLNVWRIEQADKEIEGFLAVKEEELNTFLLSEQVAGVIEKRVLGDYFGVDSIRACCALIRRIRRVFDFEALSFSLLPSWNDLGDKCQSADPVTIYTARCMQFYLPIKAGKERQALRMLLAINAVPNDPTILSQVSGYINSIVNMREQLFNRAFDPSGWEIKIDGPTGYTLTPYDSTSDDWSADFETMLNYQVIDVTTVTVPCGGPRKELRESLC